MKRGSGRIFTQPHSRFLWIQYNIAGKTYRESSRSIKQTEARALLNKRLAKAEERGEVVGSERKTTLARLVTLIKEDYASENKASARRLVYGLKHVTDFFGETTKARDIRSGKIPAYITHRQQQGASNGTINRELAALKRAFNLALEYEEVATVPTFKMLPEAPPREGFIEQTDFDALRNKLPERLRDPITFLYLSAWRLGEMLTLEWRDVYLQTGIVRLRAEASKNRKARTLPLVGELSDIFARGHAARRLDTPRVFHAVGDFRGAWKAACKAVGREGLLVHDLRRSAIRNLVRGGGGSEKVAMEISGHQTRSVFNRYDITSNDDQIRMLTMRDQYVAEQPGERKVVGIQETRIADAVNDGK